MRIENSLPREYQFDTSFDEHDDDLKDWAEFQMAESIKRYGEPDIIDSDAELDIEFEKIYQLSEDMLEGELDDANAAEKTRAVGALYRGLLFGAQLANYVDDEVTSFPVVGYLKDRDPSVSKLEKVTNDTSEYLGERPALDAFLGRYMPEIDPTGMYNHLAEAGASFMLMLNERALAETYLQNTSQALTPDFFIEKEK